MRLLFDTRALIWWLAGDEALSRRAREAIGDEVNSIAVSAASAMEAATKFRIGKFPDAALLAQDFEAIIADQGFAELPITVHHALLADHMNIANKDPFDRLLIAQAQSEDMTLISSETLSTASQSNAFGSGLRSYTIILIAWIFSYERPVQL